MRYSKQRELVMQTVQHLCDHPTAEEIYDAAVKECPGLSLGTVYRNLNSLVDAGRVRRAGHLPAQGVQLPHQVALARPAYGRVAGHVAHRVQIYRKTERLHAETRGGQRGLYPRVPRAYDGYITLSGFVSSHNLKIILPARPGIKLCENCTAKRAGGYCFISLMW